MSRVPLRGHNHGRGKEKGGSGRGCTWRPVAIVIDPTHAASIPGDPIAIGHVGTFGCTKEIKKMPWKWNVRARKFRVDFH